MRGTRALKVSLAGLGLAIAATSCSGEPASLSTTPGTANTVPATAAPRTTLLDPTTTSPATTSTSWSTKTVPESTSTTSSTTTSAPTAATEASTDAFCRKWSEFANRSVDPAMLEVPLDMNVYVAELEKLKGWFQQLAPLAPPPIGADMKMANDAAQAASASSPNFIDGPIFDALERVQAWVMTNCQGAP